MAQKFLVLLALVASCAALPTIPEIADPIFINDTATLIDDAYINGYLSLCHGAVMGLLNLTDDIAFTAAPAPGQPLRQKVTARITLPSAAITGLYTADITVFDTILPVWGNSAMAGRGKLEGHIINPDINIELFIMPLGKAGTSDMETRASLSDLDIQIAFETADVYAEGATLNGTLYDWDDFNANIHERFEEIWGQSKPTVQELVVTALNTMIEDCTILDIIGIIGGGPTDCMKIPEEEIIEDIQCQALTEPFTCPAPSGNFADPEDCAKYYACESGGVIGHLECPDGYLFNPAIENCDFPWNVDCVNKKH